MTHEAALLRAVLAAPEDDCPRLLLADWWDENGQPERAEFVRVQVALARTQCDSEPPCELFNRGLPEEAQGWCMNCCRLYALRRRERELLSANEGRWLDWLKEAWGAEWVPVRECSVVWRRGFAEIVTLTAADWLAHADALTAAAPIRAVRLTTEPPTEWILDWVGISDGNHPWSHLRAEDALRAQFGGKIDFTLPPVALPPPDEVDLGGVAHWDGPAGDIGESLRALRDQFMRDA